MYICKCANRIARIPNNVCYLVNQKRCNMLITSNMEVCKDKELCHFQKLCMFSSKSVSRKLIQAHLEQMSDLNYAVQLGTSVYAGYTPLHFLAMNISIDENETVKLMEWLINHGANLNAQNVLGSTVIHVAAEANKRTVLEFLFSCEKLLIKAINKKGVTYLHIACMIQNAAMVKQILDSAGTHILNNQMNLTNFVTRDRWNLNQIYSGGEAALHIAVLNNNLDIVKLLIDHGADVNRKDDKGFTPLHYASENNFFKIQYVLKQAMLKSTVCIENLENSEDSPKLSKIIHVANSKTVISGYSDLHLICMENNMLKMKTLLKQKIDVNKSISKDSPSWSGFTALHIAVKQGNLKISQLLLSNGADINVKDTKGETPLHLAVEEERYDIFIFLMNHGADLWVKNVSEMTPLHLTLSRYSMNGSTELIGKIIDFYVTTYQSKGEMFVDNLGISLLHIACIINNPLTVIDTLDKKFAIDKCINFDSTLFSGYTPLHLAVKFGNSEIVQILLDNCADFTLMNADGFTALHLAQEMNCLEIVELIFSSCYFKADNPISSKGISHFHIACMQNKIETFKEYMRHNVNVNQPIDFFAESKLSGCTPLHLAVDQCSIQLIRVFLNHKDIEINAVDSPSATPLHYACHGSIHLSSKLEMVELLLEHGADPNAEDLFGRRPIKIAIEQENEMLVKVLLKYKVDLNYFNPMHSFNSLHAVIDMTTLNYQMFKLLLDSGADVTVTNENKLTIMHKIVSKDLINLKRNYKVTATGLSKLISCLCWKGCDIDCQDDQGRTPLHVAFQNCNVNGAWALLKNGANINIKDDKGKIPVQYYRQYKLRANYYFNNYFMYYILKLKASNLYVDQKNNELYLRMKAFHSKVDHTVYTMWLLQEIEAMKQCKLSNYTTLYDVLHKTSNEMATLVDNKTLKRSIHLSSIKFEATFLEYSNLLLAKYNKGVICKSLVEPAKSSLTRLMDELELPDVCYGEIFKFLTIDDIRRLIRSRSL